QHIHRHHSSAQHQFAEIIMFIRGADSVMRTADHERTVYIQSFIKGETAAFFIVLGDACPAAAVPVLLNERISNHGKFLKFNIRIFIKLDAKQCQNIAVAVNQHIRIFIIKETENVKRHKTAQCSSQKVNPQHS